jgi:predicted membrane metal-binding protein
MVTLRIGMITAILAIGSVAFLPNLPSPLVLSLLLLPILARLFFKRLRWLIPLFVALFFGSVWAASYGYLGKLQQLPAPLEGVDLWVEGDVVGLPKETRRAQRFELEVLAVTSIKGEPIEQSMQRVRINWYQSGHYDESNLSHNANIRVLNTAHEGAIVVSHRDDKNIPITASQRRKFKRYWF